LTVQSPNTKVSYSWAFNSPAIIKTQVVPSCCISGITAMFTMLQCLDQRLISFTIIFSSSGEARSRTSRSEDGSFPVVNSVTTLAEVTVACIAVDTYRYTYSTKFVNRSLPIMTCEQNWRQVKTVFSNPHCISRLDETDSKFSVADSLDLSPTLFTADTDKTRQDSLVVSISAV